MSCHFFVSTTRDGRTNQTINTRDHNDGKYHQITCTGSALIRRMAAENWLWGQKRIQAELARLGLKVSARTVAKYVRPHRNRGPSPRWRTFLKQHTPNIWACDFFCVHTILFQTLYVFFVIRLANREVLHVDVTRHPTAEWAAQQIVECCAWDRGRHGF
jgi:putative transposase